MFGLFYNTDNKQLSELRDKQLSELREQTFCRSCGSRIVSKGLSFLCPKCSDPALANSVLNFQERLLWDLLFSIKQLEALRKDMGDETITTKSYVRRLAAAIEYFKGIFKE